MKPGSQDWADQGIAALSMVSLRDREPMVNDPSHQSSLAARALLPEFLGGNGAFQIARATIQFVEKCLLGLLIERIVRNRLQELASNLQPVPLRKEHGCRQDFASGGHNKNLHTS